MLLPDVFLLGYIRRRLPPGGGPDETLLPQLAGEFAENGNDLADDVAGSETSWTALMILG